MLVIDSFIPTEYQNLIEQHASWNESIGEWQIQVCRCGSASRFSLSLSLRPPPPLSLPSHPSYVFVPLPRSS